MSTSWPVRLIAVVLISLVLMVPLSMIKSLILERSRTRDKTRVGVATGWSGAQQVLGPVLLVPSGQSGRVVLPARLEVDGAIRTQRRRRGFHSVPVYTASLKLGGEFDLRELGPEPPSDALLSLALGDTRGIEAAPELVWDETPQDFAAGSLVPGSPAGVHARVGPLKSGRTYPFSIELELRGMESLRVAPVGDDTRMTLSSDWPSPSFLGRFLPSAYTIRSDGFEASWETSALASGSREIERQLNEGSGEMLSRSTFGVELLEPVDIYVLSMRSTKYGGLFIALTFLTFLVIEVSRKLVLHPVQYCLVGLALALFFLLVLSLSEHVPFFLAYLVAASACCGLIGIYAGSVMGAARRGIGTGSVLGVLYATLYVILRSEESALLAGSLLLFCCLAAAMLVTRKIDWHRLDRAAAEPPGD